MMPFTSDSHLAGARSSRLAGRGRPGAGLLAVASVLLLGLAAAQGYVSFTAQRAFVLAARHAGLPSTLEALGLDCGAVIFAVLGLAQARMGRPARVERALNVLAAAGSAAMNLLAGDLGSPRSVAVYLLPPLLYAAGSDRLIAVTGAAAGLAQTSVWQAAGRVVLYAARFTVAAPSTARGLRAWLLAATPLPGSTGRADSAGISPAAEIPAGPSVPAETGVSAAGDGERRLSKKEQAAALLATAPPVEDGQLAAWLAGQLGVSERYGRQLRMELASQNGRSTSHA